MSNLPFTSAAKDTPQDKCSNYSPAYTEINMSVLTDTSSFTSNHQLIEQQIISENFRDMNDLSLPSLYCDPSKLGDICKNIPHDNYGADENLELQNVWKFDQEKSVNHTNGSKNYVPASAQFLSETQEAICDNNDPSKDEDKDEAHQRNVGGPKSTESFSDNLTTEATFMKVEDDGVEIACTDIRKLKTAEGFYFCCSICYVSFKSRNTAILHLQEHGITKPYKCVWCENSSKTEFEAKAHHRTHGGIKRFTCSSCGRHFLKEMMLQKHKTECDLSLANSTHHSSNQYIENSSASEDSDEDGEDRIATAAVEARGSSEIYACDECDKCFPTLEDLMKHKETKHFDGNDNLRDTKYDSSPKTMNPPGKKIVNNRRTSNENNPPSGKKTEKKKKMSKAQRNFTCSTCGKSFRASKPLKEHEVVHTGARDFACEICGKAFGTRANMKIHLATHSDKRPFVCNICDATFRQKDSLKVHLRKHTGERPFPCTMCNMTFDRSFTLKNHLLTHAEEKSYVCVVCGKAFATRGGLNNHERLHLKDPTQKKERKPPSKPGTGNWICDQCGKLYSTRSNLKMHQRSHRPTAVTHPCYVCGRVYKHKDSLEVHMRRHTDQRPYPCPTCGRTFYRNWTLKLHMVTHTGEKPHKCLVEGCDKSFTQSSSLYNHIQNHHKETSETDPLKEKSVEEISERTSESALQVSSSDNMINIKQSDPVGVNPIQSADLPNSHLEVAPLFVVNTQDTPNLPNQVNNIIIPTTIGDTLNPTLTRDLAVKIGVEEIHPSVLNGLSLTSVTPEDPLGQRQDIIPQNNPMDHATHPIDANSVCNAGVPSLVWENTILPMGMNNITNVHLPSPHQSGPPSLPPLSQSLDQVYVLPNNVPLLVSVDGHLYQQDNVKMAGLQNNFVSQLR